MSTCVLKALPGKLNLISKDTHLLFSMYVPGVVGVLDRHGNVKKVTATGTRIILPDIETVGKIRTRWPIVPLHSDVSQCFPNLFVLYHDQPMN